MAVAFSGTITQTTTQTTTSTTTTSTTATTTTTSSLSFDSFNEKYTQKKFYNVERLDQANKFLLADQHGDKKSNPTNGEFVSFLASQFRVILFVEGSECMEEILDETTIEEIMKTVRIDLTVRHKMHFFGWDALKESTRSFELLR